MGLFGNKKSALDSKPGSIWSMQPEIISGYDAAMEYLTGLSAEDYTKVMQVSSVYRQSQYEACKILGVEFEPSTFITQPDEEIAFLDIEPKVKKASKKNAKG